jgi:FecR protein
MYRFLLVLIPAALFAGQTRYARLAGIEGKAEVQFHAADPWLPAERNLTLTESAWIRTSAASRLEIELDEGSVLRLGPDSFIEFSDYTRLSTGQRITVLSLDRGLAYFTGAAEGRDALSLAVPGAQITLSRGARVRLEAQDAVSRISIIEGAVRLSCSVAELDIREGQAVRVEPANSARFGLDRELVPLDLDRWSEDRDKLLAAPASAAHVALKYGVADLDGAGEWISTDTGEVWKPKVVTSWAPFQSGRWRWYDTLGYTWVSDEPWGWLPYHYGRWTRKNDLGWVWVPSKRSVFKPGDVYWLRGRQLAGWGPLAPEENWSPPTAPQQFLDLNTTYAAFAADAPVIDPAGFTARPKEPLTVAVFALALPSPTLIPARLEATRPALRVGSTARITPVVPGTSVDDADTPLPPPLPMPPPPMPPPVSQPNDPGAPPDPGGYPLPPVIYPVPVYTGIVVINPPEHPDYSRRNPNQPAPSTQPPPVRGKPSGSGNPAPPTLSQPPQPGTGSAPSSNPNPPSVPIRTPKVEPPRVGVPAPSPTDRPRVDAPPVRREAPAERPRTDAPREQPKESRPTPAPPPATSSKPEPRQEQKSDNNSRKQ